MQCQNGVTRRQGCGIVGGKLTGFICSLSAVAGTSRSGAFAFGNALIRFTRCRIVPGLFADVQAAAGKRIVLMLCEKGRISQKPALSP